ncbi:hypothetical protein BJX61DRAFT_523538 [Aspergillus egyptiacus]|nr:hypothetical protein BJX61DRAFT_523538 [Aspergillus egyptiacus]
MPRRDFQSDLAKACRPGLYSRLADVRCGSEYGTIDFTYKLPSNADAIDLQATLIEPSEYPRDHFYFVSAVTENVPGEVENILQNSLSAFHGLPVQTFLTSISERLDEALLPEDLDSDQGNGEMDLEESRDSTFLRPVESVSDVRESIRRDLRIVRDAGFRVGYLGHLNGAVILSASHRISKLGIAPEVMEAWRVRPSEYLVLLIRYPRGYLSFPEVIGSENPTGSGLVQFNAGVCKSYKPSLESAQRVFLGQETPSSTGAAVPTASARTEPVLNAIFIEKSLQPLLNRYFAYILKYRLKYNFTWTGAELYLNDGQGRLTDNGEWEDRKYYKEDNWRVAPPALLRSDHLAETERESDMSLLLIAMQFTLRRFVKCTEFCLNCYCKIDAGFEALKPFVCSKELCLYQYMDLGMGPSPEWEISSQPYVVDMLISFAYARIATGKLENFPTSVRLKVPPRLDRETETLDSDPKTLKGHLTYDELGAPSLRLYSCAAITTGDWIVLLLPPEPDRSHRELYARVRDTSSWPNISLSPLIAPGDPIHGAQPPEKPLMGEISFVVYDTDLSTLPDAQKCKSILDLLNSLPRVSKMKHFIEHGATGHLQPLNQWQDRIHASALYVLQWIIGTNRSVIVYDNDPQYHVSGMKSYLQFRFAQGAPDKEQRFVESVNQTAARLKLKYPTIFAWHGSPLSNWHCIVREGLHYKYVAHGRSYGDGIYMTTDLRTASNYAGYSVAGTFPSRNWMSSELKCTSAIALNEVVNAPSEFKCNSPYYVVQNVDWVQPRYLFIQCQSEIVSQKQLNAPLMKSPFDKVCVQDPERLVHNLKGQPLQIPISATNSHRAKQADTHLFNQQIKPGKKNAEYIDLSINDAADDDAESITTLPEDDQLLSDGKPSVSLDHSHERQERNTAPMTDFRPGSLEASSLQLLGAPTYATDEGIRRLRKLLKEALKTQEEEPLNELGWYINGNLIDNMYQWIVELHSFDENLQIARDLKQAGITSVVLEMRFPAQFPMSPPFVRIIRPRFRRFSANGGGHITAGGAMCMELLTNSGWLPTLSIENVLVQVRMAITNEHPRPARLEPGYKKGDYHVGEAIAEFKRACIAHGWTIPADIDRIQWSNSAYSN